jgi:hypothetical protein
MRNECFPGNCRAAQNNLRAAAILCCIAAWNAVGPVPFGSKALERIMQAGQIVRLRPGGRISASRAIPLEASGTVICAYRLLAGRLGGGERIDVDFRQHGVVWGQPAEAFEPAGEAPDQGARPGG